MLQQVNLQLYLSLPILLTTVPLRGWLFQVARIILQAANEAVPA